MKAEWIMLLPALVLIGAGVLALVTGLLHRLPAFESGDRCAFWVLHTRLKALAGFFSFIWPLGTTPVAIMLLVILYIPGWQIGLATSLTFLLAALGERAIKGKLGRPRPFESLPGVQMAQPIRPRDSSHPSGDALRAWFLALVFPAAFGLPSLAYALPILAAVTLSLGRVALGVHYPLDVLAGAGLGLIAAGFAIIGLQCSVFSF